jgi:hypothetical protein
MEKNHNSINKDNSIHEDFINILNNGIDMFKLFSDKEGFIENGINFDSNTKDTTTNIHQQNFSGSSNVYSPYLYYNGNQIPKNTQIPTTTQIQPTILNNFDDVIQNMSNPDINYEKKRIELNTYSDILQ